MARRHDYEPIGETSVAEAESEVRQSGVADGTLVGGWAGLGPSIASVDARRARLTWMDCMFRWRVVSTAVDRRIRSRFG